MAKNHRKYDEEFKRRAVLLSYSSDRTVQCAAQALGVRTNQIYR